MSEPQASARAPLSAELEYSSLREEVLKRIEGRQQALSITLTIAGAFVGVGWNAGSVVLLLYPLIALLLAAGWAQNEIIIRQLNRYIRDYLEEQVTVMGWERYSRQRMTETRLFGWPIDVLATGGIFIVTQLMAMGLGTYKFGDSSLEWILLILDLAAVILMGWVLDMVRRRDMM
jgi:hypothetical protein